MLISPNNLSRVSLVASENLVVKNLTEKKGGRIELSFLDFPESGSNFYLKGKIERGLFSSVLKHSKVCLCALLIYTITTRILCVSQEGLGLFESNKQLCDFSKWVIFEKQRHFKFGV